MADMAIDAEERRRLSSAFRDVAVFAASTERRPWTLPWQEVADKFVVDIANIDGAAGPLLECSWELVGEGASGAFELPAPSSPDVVLSALAERIGDLAAELWRAP
jgi:hypothetical protein